MKKIDCDLELVNDFFKGIAEAICPEFKIDIYNSNTINEMIKYFTGQQCKYDSTKGIFLHGKVGCGKTILMKIFKELTGKIFQQNSFKFTDSHTIVSDYLINGPAGLTEYNDRNELPRTYCIDDLGCELLNVKYYGTQENVMSNILTARHKLLDRGIFTHLTTNLTASQITEFYGERILSRFKEMFNDIPLLGEDRRK